MIDAQFVDAMERCARTFEHYRGRLPLVPYAYTRTRILRTDRFEVVAMQWAARSSSPIHDHGTSRCWVLLMGGALEVENFEVDDPSGDPVSLRETGRFALAAGDLDFRGGPRELHRVWNPSDEPAFSLQLYAEPITAYTVIDAHTLRGRSAIAVCDLDLTLV